MKQDLVIVNNEKCFRINNKLYCQNIEIKLLSEDLKKYFDLRFILRNSKVKPVHQLNQDNIKIASNIGSFLYNILIYTLKRNTKFLLISITPYTFLSFLILFLFRKKIYLYLRSDGQKETKHIFGKKFLFIYNLMQFLMIKGSKLIVVNNEIVKNRNFSIVQPSSLDKSWTNNVTNPNLNKITLLYVGRLKVEKGIYSLINIFSKFVKNKSNSTLTMIGHGDQILNLPPEINLLEPTANKNDLINIYDHHNLLILPSFTEGYPRVILESLSRRRPVLVFDEISHVKKDFYGVYVCKRNEKSFTEAVEYIFKNYNSIKFELEKNKLPTREDFALQLSKLINS